MPAQRQAERVPEGLEKAPDTDVALIRDRITMACWLKVASFTRSWEAILAKGGNSYRISRSATTSNSVHFG